MGGQSRGNTSFRICAPMPEKVSKMRSCPFRGAPSNETNILGDLNTDFDCRKVFEACFDGVIEQLLAELDQTLKAFPRIKVGSDANLSELQC